MPRYFFNVRDAAGSPDMEGIELPGLHAARVEAIRFAGETLRDEAHDLSNQDRWKLDVFDDTGLLLFSLAIEFIDMPEASPDA